eukprot:scaffold762_cov363-Pavlova_lutheri.AAC.21
MGSTFKRELLPGPSVQASNLEWRTGSKWKVGEPEDHGPPSQSSKRRVSLPVPWPMEMWIASSCQS